MTVQISNSEIATFLRCPRKWYVQYYLGVAPAEEQVTGNMILGTRIHAALQGWRGYDLDPLAVLVLLYRQAAEKHPEAERDLAAEEELARVMTEGLIEWLAETGEDAGLSVVAAEQEVTAPLPGLPGVELRAKLDTLMRDDSDGSLMFDDWKTSDSFERHEILALDPQFKFYSLVRVLRAEHDGRSERSATRGMVTTLRRCKRTSRSSPPYYRRDRFRYNPDEIAATLRKVDWTCRRIMMMRESLGQLYAETGGDLEQVNDFQQRALPPNEMPRDCSWSCPLVTLCPMMNDGSDWPGVITSSGRFTQRDPYVYYAEDPVRAIREQLAGTG